MYSLSMAHDQVVHLDMAETDPDLDQDFPKMSIS
jgi:hypothetical protein